MEPKIRRENANTVRHVCKQRYYFNIYSRYSRNNVWHFSQGWTKKTFFHLRQDLDRCRKGVELSPSVIGNPNGVGPVLDSLSSIFLGHDALDHNLSKVTRIGKGNSYILFLSCSFMYSSMHSSIPGGQRYYMYVWSSHIAEYRPTG